MATAQSKWFWCAARTVPDAVCRPGSCIVPASFAVSMRKASKSVFRSALSLRSGLAMLPVLVHLSTPGRRASSSCRPGGRQSCPVFMLMRLESNEAACGKTSARGKSSGSVPRKSTRSNDSSSVLCCLRARADGGLAAWAFAPCSRLSGACRGGGASPNCSPCRLAVHALLANRYTAPLSEPLWN